jgi:hypothetical protein
MATFDSTNIRSKLRMLLKYFASLRIIITSFMAVE